MFVDPDDDGALGDAIQSLLASPARRHELGRRAHARACAFTADRMVAGYLAAYQRILQPEHAGRVAASA